MREVEKIGLCNVGCMTLDRGAWYRCLTASQSAGDTFFKHFREDDAVVRGRVCEAEIYEGHVGALSIVRVSGSNSAD